VVHHPRHVLVVPEGGQLVHADDVQLLQPLRVQPCLHHALEDGAHPSLRFATANTAEGAHGKQSANLRSQAVPSERLGGGRSEAAAPSPAVDSPSTVRDPPLLQESRFYELFDNMRLPERWVLGSPLSEQGNEVDPWQFKKGRVLELGCVPRFTLDLPGHPLDFSWAAFSIPVVLNTRAPMEVMLPVNAIAASSQEGVLRFPRMPKMS
jgi:hypothetical protein